MINTKCPYCGSSNMTVDMDIRITGDLQEDGTVILRKHWTDYDELQSQVNENDSDHMQGWCADCDGYCSFSWEKGFIKGGGIDDV